MTVDDYKRYLMKKVLMFHSDTAVFYNKKAGIFSLYCGVSVCYPTLHPNARCADLYGIVYNGWQIF